MTNCIMCKKEMKSLSPNRKYCYECRKEVLKVWSRKSAQKRKSQ